MFIYRLIYCRAIRCEAAFKSISGASHRIINHSQLWDENFIWIFSFLISVAQAKFLFRFIKIHCWVMEIEGDNPFGPVCGCFACQNRQAPSMKKTSSATGKAQGKKRRSRRRRQLYAVPSCCLFPRFNLLWKPTIPCLFCKKPDCPHRFFHSHASCKDIESE